MPTPRRIPPSLLVRVTTVCCLAVSPALARTAAPQSARDQGAVIRITSPRPINGRGEWRPAEGESGFLSTTSVTCEATVQRGPARAEADGGDSDRFAPHVPRSAIHWSITVLRDGRSVGTMTGIGSPFNFQPAAAMRHRCSGSLSLEITASLRAEANEAGTENEDDQRPSQPSSLPERAEGPGEAPPPALATDRVCIKQDEIDQLRQEYLDLPGRKLNLVPRRAFLDRAAYERADGSPIPWTDVNRTCRRDGAAYGYILFTDALRDGLRKWQGLLGARPLTVNSGYRNPFKQRITNGRGGREGASGSMHQYGRAVDVRASLRQDPRDWVQVAWAALDAGADYVETAPEGGWSHVHADWRHDGQGPPLTCKLEIAGRVVDSEGKPVPMAQILGSSDAAGGRAGMPPWTGPDEEGRFVLRTVWRPGRPYRLVAQGEPGYGTQVVPVPDGVTGLVHLEAELVLTPEAVRVALASRATGLASRGGRGAWRRHRYSYRRHRR